MKKMRLGVIAQIVCLMAASVLLPAAAEAQNGTGAAPATAATSSDTARRASPNRKYLRSGQGAAKSAAIGVTTSESRKARPEGNDDELVDLRDEYLSTLRGFEAGQPFDYSARSRAIEFANSQRITLPSRPGTSPALIQLLTIPSWTELGPSPIPNGQTNPVNPVSGRVTAIEVDPTDPNKVYVGTAQGGVYRSLNGGSTWAPIFDGALSLSIGALALDAANGRLYVGTGEANGSGDSFSGVGLYRIDNVNTTAALVGPINPVRNYLNASNVAVSASVFTGRSVSKILIVPNDPTTLFVGTAGGVIGIGGDAPFGGTIPPLGLRGLYKLTGVTGAPASVAVTRIGVRDGTGKEGCFDNPCTGNRNVNDMVFDPGDVSGNTLILWLNGSTVALDGGAWRSTNALAATPTFTQSLITTTSSARAALAVYKQGANPAVIYAATGETNGALRVSADGGVSFSAKLAGGAGFCSAQCFYDIALAVLPGATAATNDDKVLLGGAATTIQATSLTGGTTAFVNHQAGLHADSHALVIAPSDSNIVYRGDDGGIWKSIDGGDTWSSLNNATFRATQFSGLSVHPTDPNFTIGGTQDNGTNQLLASGSAWNRVDFGDGGFALIDQNATDTANVTMYHTYFNQANSLIGFGRVLSNACASDGQWAFKGIYGGAVDPTAYCDGSTDTFNGIGLADTVNFYAPMALGPGNPNTVYFGSNKLYRSANKGDAMPAVSQTMSSNVSSIAISPQDDNYRLVGLNNGGLFFTTTGANPLTSLDPVAGAGVIPDKYVGRVLFDPTNKNTAYVGLGGYMAGTTAALSHVWKITNLSTTPVLTAINGSGATGLPDIPVNALAVDPLQPLRLFVGTDIGVFVSEDGGASWAPFGTGLPNVAVFGVEIQKIKRVLRIATHGRGMWEIALPTALTLRKTWVNAISGNQVNVTSAGFTNNAASGFSTSTGNNTDVVSTVLAFAGESGTISEAFTIGNPGNYNASLACTGNAIALSGNTLTVAAGDTAIVCTQSNTRKQATLTLTKAWVNGIVGNTATVATSAGFTNAASSGLSTSSGNNSTAGSPVVVFAAESGNISETFGVGSASNYTVTLACTGNATPLSGATLTVNPLDTSISCTQTNTSRSLTLRKIWVNGKVGDTATVTTGAGFANAASSGSSVSSGNNTTTGSPVVVFAGESGAISETFSVGSVGNYLATLACTGNAAPLSGNTLTVSAADTNIVCTQTNTRRQATLTLVKTWVNGKISDTSTVTSTGFASAASSGLSTSTGNNSTTGTPVTVFAGESGTIGEAFGVGNAANYTATLVCTGNATPLSGSTLTVNAADTAITCAQTNTRRQATLTLAKTWVNAVNGNTATVTSTGFSNTASSGLSTSAGNNTTTGSPVVVFAGDSGTIGEVFGLGSANNYNATVACSGNATAISGNSLTVTAGDTAISCTLTNTRKLATLTLVKTWVNGISGNTATVSNAGFINSATSGLSTATGNNTTTGTPVVVFSGESGTITETYGGGTNAGNYLASLACTGNSTALSGNTLIVNPADTAIVCTQTNTGRTLTLRKTWVNGKNGDAATVTSAGFSTVASTGVSTSTGNNTTTGAPVVVAVGQSGTIAEVFSVGTASNYSATLTCSGTTGLSGNTLTVNANDTAIVCTQTNTSKASVTGTKTVAGTLVSGASVTYTVVLTNAGLGAQADNPGNEFTDVLPPTLTLVSAAASSGTAVATVASNTVTWNGGIAASGSVTITIVATVNVATLPGTVVSNQGSIAFDSDGNGSNESTTTTDDPAVAGTNDPTSFTVRPSLDVDASLTSTRYNALTDGRLVMRYLLGLSGSSLTTGALGPTAGRTSPAAITAYLDAMRNALDVDGDTNTDALTDGVLILRYLLGLTGSALTQNALAPGATRNAAQIEAYLLGLMP